MTRFFVLPSHPIPRVVRISSSRLAFSIATLWRAGGSSGSDEVRYNINEDEQRSEHGERRFGRVKAIMHKMTGRETKQSHEELMLLKSRDQPVTGRNRRKPVVV